MDNLEKQRALTILAGTGATVSQLGLRFDKVVVELLGDLRTFVEGAVPEGRPRFRRIRPPVPASPDPSSFSREHRPIPGRWCKSAEPPPR
jgi:hypothetical protein